jgi:hypothetical protein
MTPVPLENTPVRLALPPAVTVVGFAVKLVIAGCRFTKLPVEQPLSPIKDRLRNIAAETKAFKRFITLL